MTKKIEPSEEYLSQLEEDLVIAIQVFGAAKRTLYQYTAIAKIGEPEFEKARKDCLDSNKAVEKLEVEILKVRRALR